MRFIAFAALLLGATALPANEKRDACCCCDISEPAIVCQESTDGCFCADVVCPPGVPTLWPIAVEATAAPSKRSSNGDSGKGKSPFECCCCDPTQLAVVCDAKASPEDCICPAIVCPDSAPTITHAATASPTPDEPCCCCNIGKGEIVCEIKPSDEGCFCNMVVCPADAPTVTVWPEAPAYTG
ncbi:Fc.00g110680.m01.CDS01 [Cosmosporella sp. VM-42]